MKLGGDPVRVHGGAGTRLYNIYRHMLERCFTATSTHYPRYGARGITVCDEWKSSFEAFRDWAQTHGYASDLTLDREDNNGNYSPENCRWITRKHQAYNRGPLSNNTSGRTGVYWNKKLQKWRAGIHVDGEWIHLGYYTEFDMAVAARQLAEKEFGFTCG